MAETRALLTGTERDRIAERDDAGKSKKYQAVTRVRNRIQDELPKDVAVLREHHPGLFEELRDAVCGPDETDDIAATGSSDTPETAHEPREQPEEQPPGSPRISRPGVGDSQDLADAVREYLEANDLPPKTAHGRNLVIDVFRLLRREGAMKTGDIQDTVHPDYAEHWSDGRTMWNAVDRYLEDVPGIEKAGYGEWGYAGDSTVREQLGDGS